ncbi:accessory gene regulator B family protein [Desulfosporosinus sp. PR]|uniref:accessory gene regulator B family protein n=1 Tax=Candidatus Desulfosporosinus nitrosoreducens TaxID=3401928 RepID=UPI0027FFAD5B|nr:accessory gene regulator B family protein [Desulfosporosinus sp. PR]
MLETVLLDVLSVSIIVLFGYALNVLVPAVLAAGFGSLLCRVSGGAHLKEPITLLNEVPFSFLKGSLFKYLLKFLGYVNLCQQKRYSFCFHTFKNIAI